jgi:hypothetical protein
MTQRASTATKTDYLTTRMEAIAAENDINSYSAVTEFTFNGLMYQRIRPADVADVVPARTEFDTRQRLVRMEDGIARVFPSINGDPDKYIRILVCPLGHEPFAYFRR